MSMIRVFLIFLALLLTSIFCLACCSVHSAVKRPYAEPTFEGVLAYLGAQQKGSNTYQAESIMDYWVDDERVKGVVLILGKRGAKVRFNALNPTGEMVAVDLACDGTNFNFVDTNNNCVLFGPCNAGSIAQLLRVSLAPDDFLLLALGSTPLIPHRSGTLKWNSESRREELKLIGKNGEVQTISLLNKNGEWLVISSQVIDAAGNIDWTLTNKNFRTVKDVHGKPFILPGKTRFQQPKYKADLIVTWKERKLGIALDDEKFHLELPSGLPECR